MSTELRSLAGSDSADHLRAWFGPERDNVPRFLSRDDCVTLAHNVMRAVRGDGLSRVNIVSDWTGEVRWARNRAYVTSDRRNHHIGITRAYKRGITVFLNQLDEISLADAVRRAENTAGWGGASSSFFAPSLPPVNFEYPETHIWSETTYAQPQNTRGAVARSLTEAAERNGMLSAGYLNVAARGTAIVDFRDISKFLYAPQTLAQCSMTVRDPNGLGSGWAGASSYDWSQFSPEKLAAVALEKCLKSRNPVAVEPGRYTVILEPQAVYSFVNTFMSHMNRVDAELPGAVFWSRMNAANIQGDRYPVSLSKLDERIIDDRVTIDHDPTDPALGVLPFSDEVLYVEPFRKTTWVERGVFQTFPYDRKYALQQVHENRGYPYSGSFRMSGGPTTVDEMIATTKRGLLVTRFSEMYEVDGLSMLYSGLTRDGIWLIENGKVSKSVKNFRFTESPLFVLNQIEQLGVPMPVFSPGFPAIVPPLKVKDFSMTSLSDAV